MNASTIRRRAASPIPWKICRATAARIRQGEDTLEALHHACIANPETLEHNARLFVAAHSGYCGDYREFFPEEYGPHYLDRETWPLYENFKAPTR